MTPEEYQRIKEEEKAHLRALKQLKQRVRELDKKRKISQTMADLTTSAASLLRASGESLEKLAMETLRNEARTEVALEDEALRNTGTSSTTAGPTPEQEEFLQKAKAMDLVRQLKMEMGTPEQERTIGRAEAPPEGTADEPSSDSASKSASPSDSPSGKAPEKTIGRMRR